ncbi:MAG TPA: MGMT family protein [Verrucomicrobiae bacterium]
MNTLPIHTEYGTFFARYSSNGLTELRFPDDTATLQISAETPPAWHAWHERTSNAVSAILKNDAADQLPPFDLSPHTEFRRRVWSILQQIPAGQTLTYSAVAARLGQPSASRAVGGACGANPIPLLIPCHRVLGSNDSLTGFSGGLHWKRRLLSLEGILLDTKPRQLALVEFA